MCYTHLDLACTLVDVRIMMWHMLQLKTSRQTKTPAKERNKGNGGRKVSEISFECIDFARLSGAVAQSKKLEQGSAHESLRSSSITSKSAPPCFRVKVLAASSTSVSVRTTHQYARQLQRSPSPESSSSSSHVQRCLLNARRERRRSSALAKRRD